jgi:transposase-like protein
MASKKKSRTRRTYSPKLKFQAALEVLTGSKSVGQVARAYGVHANSVGLWRKAVLERGPELFSQETAMADYERRIGELERLLGQKEVEIALLKNFLGQSG